jgi:integrase
VSLENETIKTPGKFVVELYPLPWSGVRVFRTKHSGQVWQFSAWIKEEGKYYGKSLRTRSLPEAVEQAEEIYLDLKIKARNGEKIFAITINELVAWYVDQRRSDVTNQFITKGRLTAISSQLKHLVRFIGSGTKVNRFKGEQFRGYQSWRREQAPTVKTATIQNEQSTISHALKMALEEGFITHHQLPKWGRNFSDGVSRREAFTPDEYRTIYRAFPKWIRDEKDVDRKLEKQIVRDFILISVNTGMRLGELRQLKWHMVTRILSQKGRSPNRPFVELNLPAEITKNRKARQVVGRAGAFFKRIRSYSSFNDTTDFVISDQKSNKQFSSKRLYELWDELLEVTGLNAKPRKPTYYCLRHTYATFRLMYGEVNPLLLAQNMGCSVTFLEQHYGHVRTADMVNTLTRVIRENKEAFDMVES